jgi:hypothetical protein
MASLRHMFVFLKRRSMFRFYLVPCGKRKPEIQPKDANPEAMVSSFTTLLRPVFCITHITVVTLSEKHDFLKNKGIGHFLLVRLFAHRRYFIGLIHPLLPKNDLQMTSCPVYSHMFVIFVLRIM